ncbi:hypothetical protein GCM10010413_13450 [Promicromonospora sukumoe]|uniref:Uncharacterized protein n=1 Tax=Promicromonospora sukumoe TaxID=88382 RepID=A0A7W3J637_9MICO|nr:hypothetical protein [Promicromonospora sukumoe]MBA8807002.1 hypothetical protein [Promicromonospora sukumoe]
MAQVLEITTLRPAPGRTPEDFVTANADIDDYLRRQPGFLGRRIAVRDDGTVVDVVAYDSMAHARAGAGGITGEMGDSPVHDTIDQTSVDWQLTTVLHEVEPPAPSGTPAVRDGAEPDPAGQTLAQADATAREVRALYEQIEQRVLGRTWTLPELAVGFTNDAAYVGRLVLAAEHTWDISGDVDAELRHKLAENMWWLFVLADKLGVDLPAAYAETMAKIGGGLRG